MNMKRIFALAFAVLMVLALAACGMKNNDKMGDMSGNGSAMTGEPKNAEEALSLHKELLERENAILSENTELWEKVFKMCIRDRDEYHVRYENRAKHSGRQVKLTHMIIDNVEYEVIAVSYTHLDVYKRQELRELGIPVIFEEQNINSIYPESE